MDRPLAVLTCICLAACSYTHEPLWGETAQTFAFGVVHPEVKFGYGTSRGLFSGASRIEDHMRGRQFHFDTHVSVAYAPSTRLNVKFELPLVIGGAEEWMDGQKRTSSWSGVGNALVTGKSRVAARLTPTSKEMHSVIAGIQLPTGQRSARHPDGSPMPPSEQPGTGNFGLRLGYAASFERLQDTVWLSAMYETEVTGSERRGDRLMLDGAYGYWIRRAYTPEDLGVVLAAGPHIELTGRDRGFADSTGHTRWGLQATLIATKGVQQFRAGLYVPVHQQYVGVQSGRGVEVRLAWEMFF
jgi:hypothetical protein